MMKRVPKMAMTTLMVLAMLLSPLLAGASGPAIPVAQEPVQYLCLPTCDQTDSRMLALAGSGLNTLAGDMVSVEFAAPAAASTLEIGIFDGDTGGFWDVGTVPLEYTLYADPAADGSGTVLVGQWLGNTMPDNDWFTISIATGPEALAPSGHYFYRMLVRNTDYTATNASMFKLRTDGFVSFKPVAFAFVSSLNSVDDAAVVYPDWPNLTPTTYDGTLDLYLDVGTSVSHLEAWDGDFDYGTSDGTDADTDDADTPALIVPPWAANTPAVPEGVAVGTNGSTGAPPDDYSSAVFARSPSVVYEIIDPDGNSYRNDDPSGNLEWEQFRIDTDASEPADYYVDENLPPGIYQVHVEGLDLSNLNAWRFHHDVLGVCEDNTPCKPFAKPYLIGDTVWYDADGDGEQDAGEPGIPGVVVNLVDAYGFVLDTATTDENGNYTFGVEAGAHTVQIADENMSGPLAGLSPTRGNERTGPVDLNYDFGYAGDGVYSVGAIGDRVWLDFDGDGVQDPGEPGLPNVVVTLTDATGGVTTMTTDGAGNYLFDHLQAGDYTVAVDASTLYAELTQTYDLDGLATPHTASVSIAKDEANLDVDFGYELICGPPKGSIGDYVWHDQGRSQYDPVNGVQDDGEPGIEGVVVELYSGSGNLLDTVTTDANGYYEFGGLDAGTYTVKIADSNFESGGVLENWYAAPDNRGGDDALDSDGSRRTHRAAVTIAEGEDNDTIDFGFFHTCVKLTKTGPTEGVAGEAIVYRFVIENCGDLVLHTGADVYDPLINPDGVIWHGVLWPGQEGSFDRTYYSDESDCGPLTNNAWAEGHPMHPDGYYLKNVYDYSDWTVELDCGTS